MDEPLFNELLESVKQADQIMTDHAELRRLAKAAEFGGGAHEDIEFSNQLDFHAACTPAAILALLDEIDGLSDELSACTEHPGGCGYWREAAKRRTEEHDQIKAEVERFKEANREISETNTRRRDENVRLKAQNEALRRFAAEAYQVLGALEAPENVLDNASDAANGVPMRHETLLPFFAEDYEALRKDAERWRYARTILPYEVIQDAQKDLESWNVGVSEAENKRCDEAIDAALEGATQ
ncbi:hypothetical protein FA389_07915 [Pseudomonas aeruginosa]|nr:hypothetical protein [Pseudomonas aeruginosa]MCO2658741.1 hypothetical protein [Pseudomonas aeruginosa]